MTPTNVALPKGSLILVTGANGYIGSHVVDRLLKDGYNVRGTIRTEKPWLVELFEGRYGKGRFEAVIVPGIEAEGAFDQVTEGVSGFIHVASDVSLGADPQKVITVAVNGIKNALEAAAKQPSIKRVVLTSSSSAAYFPVANKGGVVDKDTWNDEAVAGAWDPNTLEDQKNFMVYAASKAEAEREAWKWLKNNKHQFAFNSVLPNYNIGPKFCPEITGSTMTYLTKLLDGDDFPIKFFPPQFYIDVRDCAKLHIIGLLDPSVHDERIYAFAGEFNWTDVVGILRKLRPENKSIPSAPENEGRDLSDVKLIPHAEELLKSFYGHGWTSLEESLKEGI
ncbi:Fc.00g072150.m01.CDS01 [Cosmosporella sp. VM-42]